MSAQIRLTLNSQDPWHHELAAHLRSRLPPEQDLPVDYELRLDAQGVSLVNLHHPEQKPLMVDFTAGGAAHRRKFGGGKSQLLAKALGIQGKLRPSICDATAGLGGDAFVMACLGAQVTLCERSPWVYALLADGLHRARHYAQACDPELLEILQRMRLISGDSISVLQGLAHFPVLYLDPMFPERQKTAQVKKSMQYFQDLVGDDLDADQLFQAAWEKTWCRLVVKRPKSAATLVAREPNVVLAGQSCRFDVYTQRKLAPETLAACGGFQG